MTDLLIVVDMQRDFVSGALGSEQARAIVPAVAARIRQAKAEQTQVAFTLDTHEPDYLNTREGRFLPVPHCIRDARLGARTGYRQGMCAGHDLLCEADLRLCGAV